MSETEQKIIAVNKQGRQIELVQHGEWLHNQSCVEDDPASGLQVFRGIKGLTRGEWTIVTNPEIRS